MYRNRNAAVYLMVGLMLIVSACSTAGTQVGAQQDQQSADTQADQVEAVEPAPAIEPLVIVEDQALEASSITVQEVISAGPGWMVIHATAEGKPGPILGFTQVSEGHNDDVRVEIDASKATDQLFAMLHVDQGEIGTFEFPEGEDKPAFAGETMVNVPFNVQFPEAESQAGTLNLFKSELGKVLVDSSGMALYLFVPDAQGESTCYDTCEANWPPLIADGEISVGEGLDADLVATVARADGSLQVTYNNWPLYYFVRDEAPGDLLGQGVNNIWFLVNAAGDSLVQDESSEYKQ